jgi:two-component system, NarL family, invasion response regulator UvrY
MIKVLIADDHPVVREGLKQIISKSIDINVGGEAFHWQEVLDKVHREHWDVLVLDLHMKGHNGLEVLKELHSEKPKLPILVLSVESEDQVGVRVLKAGASGFMNKEGAPKELISAIRKIVGGGKYISAALAEKLADRLDMDLKAKPHENLSDREYQVFCMIVSGLAVKEIADQLAISEKTVRTYRERVMMKMNMKNDVELTHYAILHKLVQQANS